MYKRILIAWCVGGGINIVSVDFQTIKSDGHNLNFL